MYIYKKTVFTTYIYMYIYTKVKKVMLSSHNKNNRFFSFFNFVSM